MAAPDDLTPEQALDRLFQNRIGRTPGPFGVAVSGGGDSLALLIAAENHARSGNLPFHAATVNHGLRSDAAEEAQQVATFCAARGIPHHILSLTLNDGPDLQARARRARYDALRAWAQTAGLSPVLIGHTQDDVAESLVMRLRRGVGLEGLAEMPGWWTDDAHQEWARPFLGLSRARLRSYLVEHDIVPIEDPSNEDTRFERVEIRKALATLGWTDGALARSARHLARAAQSYDARLDALFDTYFRAEDGDLLFDRQEALALEASEPDSYRRLLLAALAWIGRRASPREAEQANLARFIRLIDIPGITLGGCRIISEGASIRIFRELSACPPEVPFGQIWDGRWAVHGPDQDGLTIGALGADAQQMIGRGGPRPVASLMADPAIWRGNDLIAAPTAGLPNSYEVRLHDNPRAAFRRRRLFYN